MQQQHTPPPERGDTTTELLTPKPEGETEEYDWTEDLPQTDHVRFFRQTDWGKSRLGPLKEWNHTLRIFTCMLFADSRAACLWWGPHLVAIYNEAYMPLSAHAHPGLMGAAFPEGYPDLWTQIKPYFDKAREQGSGVDYSSAHSLMVQRKGWKEEAFFNGNFVPIGNGPTNQPEGFYNSLFEVTSQRLADRRTMLLNRLASVPDFSLDAVCSHLLEVLKTNGEDIPLAILYEVEESSESSVLRLRGHIGLPKGHNLIVDGQAIHSDEGLSPDCRHAGLEPTFIDYDDRFDSISWAGWGSPSKKIAILPITSGKRILGYLITGANPCRPHDENCHQFTKDLSRMVSSLFSTAVNMEQTKVRQQKLENDLALSDMKLRHLIEHASVGMVHISLDGHIIWGNDHYYELSGVPAENQRGDCTHFDVWLDEDRIKAVEVWDNLIAGVNHVSVELRLKRLYTSPIGDAEPAQLQVLAFPYREDGEVKSIMACTTDISRLKWAQSFQARLAAEAREAKRQQEAFIDVVSHEMRNPLSAIVHCADGIANAVEECHTLLADIPNPCIEALNDNLASANIILQCANHQKRIIDDVLTLSKLDSMLLSITPSAVRPSKLINSIISIFEPELKSNKIRYTVDQDVSLTELNVDYLYFDPSRVTQIFINLLTNAIKFVKSSKDPVLSVRFGACKARPRDFFPTDTFWASKSKETGDVTTNSEWGTGESMYLTFTVRDSGIGLRDKEIHKVFERFRQANTKTHVRYGGSGLGLFISKELTEKQGGEIGVSSSLGRGSVFGFYVKTRRVERRPQTLGELFHECGGTGPAPQQLAVLLVEDNIINQQVLGKQLKKAGCLVDVANHGLEALDMLEKKVFDVVLMDLEMPVLNGLAAMQEIRKRELEGEGLLGQAMEISNRGGGRLPIIAVTANVRQEQIDSAMTAGADRVMQKPFKAADLVYMMKGLVPQVTTPATEVATPGLNEKLGGLFAT
ncbi:putative histidine kinase HHK15p [Massarina eburnea CBS 473.64]|uniref:histidine kinase n=1 Tax=Massarina eburnea CBS 473.64 TaxID=1395130 RepID=A0A6A6RRV5_9PLEO|nr:putative histidine kinase HHK15p [Massarina eburnea CBS 473.64]